MLVQCTSCKQHYDDSSQTSRCPNVTNSRHGISDALMSHGEVSPSALDNHRMAVRAYSQGRAKQPRRGT